RERQLLQATAEPVDAPGRDDVELAPRDRPVQAIESRLLVAPIRTAHFLVAKLSHDAPVAPLNRSLQVAPLVLDRLLAGADPMIEVNRLRLAHQSRLTPRSFRRAPGNAARLGHRSTAGRRERHNRSGALALDQPRDLLFPAVRHRVKFGMRNGPTVSRIGARR